MLGPSEKPLEIGETSGGRLGNMSGWGRRLSLYLEIAFPPLSLRVGPDPSSSLNPEGSGFLLPSSKWGWGLGPGYR
jgi:hypothetical protein